VDGSEARVRCFAAPSAHANGDRTPSTSVNLVTGVWHCFGCSGSGNFYQAARACGRSPAEALALATKYRLSDAGGGETGDESKADRVFFEVAEEDLKRWTRRLLQDPGLLDKLEAYRGWTKDALTRLEVGYDGERLVFPHRDAKGRLVGLRRYLPMNARGEGLKMLAAPGTRPQLFPQPEAVDEDDGYLLLTEGEPDAITATAYGLAAVARPSTAPLASGDVGRFAGRRVAVIADADQPDRTAAGRVARQLASIAKEVRVVDFTERSNGYDLSDFLMERSDAAQARADLAALIAAAPLASEDWDIRTQTTALLEDLVRLMRRFVVCSDEELAAIALWVLHTHVLEAAEATPYLAITSAEKESGKTRLLETLDLVVARPWSTGGATPAVLVRKVDKHSTDAAAR
jgi:hypothetical protein